MKKDAPIKLTRKGSKYLLPRIFKPKIEKPDWLLLIGRFLFF